MFDVAIIASTMPARASLLERSIRTWEASALASGLNVAIRIHADGLESIRRVTENCVDTSIYINAGRSGSHVAGYNYWLEQTEAKIYLFTHPDMLFPADTVSVAYEQAKPNTFVAFKCFWLPPDFTRDLDSLDWMHPETLEQEPRLFELDELLKGWFYANATARQIEKWESTTTFAVDHALAHKIYPMPDLKRQGFDDPLHFLVRQALGVRNHTVQNPMLFHQWHENSWNGTGEEAVEDALRIFREHYQERLKK